MQGKEKRSVKQISQDLKMEIRSSQNTLLIAVDIGKIRNCACFVSSSGKVLRRRFFFTNTIDGFKNLARQTKFFRIRKNCQLLYSVWNHRDITGSICTNILIFEKKRKWWVSPLAVNRNRETINVSKDKSDPKDAYNIADLIKQGKFYFAIYRDKEIRQLKRFIRDTIGLSLKRHPWGLV